MMDEKEHENVMEVIARTRVRRGLAEVLGGVALLRAVEVARDLEAAGAIDELTARRAVFEISSRLVVGQGRQPMTDAGQGYQVGLDEPVAALEAPADKEKGTPESPDGSRHRTRRAGGDEANMEANLAMPTTTLKPIRCPICKIPISVSSAGCLAHWRRVKRDRAIESAGEET